eukprot:SAG22_NODE_5588_length_988_cov_3.145107_1_plen_229_part_01
MASAVQIIEIQDSGTVDEPKASIVLHEELLQPILDKVPPTMKISVVAVAGAFRTGKSFLLGLFLRYLEAGAEGADGAWLSEGGDYLDGNSNEAPGGLVRAGSEQGFAWKGGRKRQTTGIWIWSEPRILKMPGTGEEVALLLIDTQGMFDSQLTAQLTACIFGLSTLISSRMIYNLQGRIQEDNLQHLALFAEYGRAAQVVDDRHQEHQQAAAAAAAAGGGDEPAAEGGE